MKITGLHLIHLPLTDSTQAYLKGLLDAGSIAEGTLVWADQQSAGRGNGGNHWQSEPGKNLLFSFVRYPSLLNAADFFLLSKVVALAVRDVVQSYITTAEVKVKWPNDIYVDDRKVAGILIENALMGDRFRYSIAGIGLNVNQTLFPEAVPNPVSLKMLTGMDLPLNKVLEDLCERLDFRYAQLKQRRLLNREFDAVLYRKGQWAAYFYQGRQIEAKITGLSRQGFLRLKVLRGARIECGMKEITYVIPLPKQTQ